MPRDPFPVSRHLAEEVRSPGDHILPDQILNPIHNAPIRQNVINAAITQVRRTDGVTVSAFGYSLREQLVEIPADAHHFVFAEYLNVRHIAITVESRNLFC